MQYDDFVGQVTSRAHSKGWQQQRGIGLFAFSNSERCSVS